MKKFFDELAADEPILNPIKHLEVTVFNAYIDVIIGQLDKRFSAFKTVYSKFSILNPQILLKSNDSQILEQSQLLVEKYSNDLNNQLAVELIQIKSLLYNNIKNLNTTREFANYIFEENELLLSSLPELCSAFQLFLVLPVTSAQSERSFSKLKIIKNVLRSTMTQNRLSSLALISIEHERAKKINIDQVVDQYLTNRFQHKRV